ncbi:MAG: hypothetical protein ACRDPO_03830, partial [Streptosporangiaceae bacterium]
MADVLGYLPIIATILAMPQFLPQILKLRRTGDTTGVSWAWAMLTSVNSAAWLACFVLSGFWSALAAASAAVLLAGVLAVLLARRGQRTRRATILITGWSAALIVTGAGAGRIALGTLLAAAFAGQVAPSIWSAYRTAHPTGISRGTWLLILGELACWAAYGADKSDPRLITLGGLGVVASVLMLARAAWAGRRSGQGTSGRSTSGRSTSGRSTSGRSTSGRSTSGQGTSGGGGR